MSILFLSLKFSLFDLVLLPAILVAIQDAMPMPPPPKGSSREKASNADVSESKNFVPATKDTRFCQDSLSWFYHLNQAYLFCMAWLASNSVSWILPAFSLSTSTEFG